jgi:hypothetical protein
VKEANDMKYLKNNDGIALVTSLMFTALALVMCMSLLYMITSGIKTSSAIKQYRTALDAAYGGTDILTKDLLAAAFSFRNLSGTAYKNQMKTTYMANLNQANISDCLRTKLTKPRSQWGGCADSTLSPKFGTDISFDLHAASGSPFTVYAKVVDTMDRKFQVLESYSSSQKTLTVMRAGNTDESSTSLEYGSTTDGSGVTVPHYPYLYRIEVQGERRQNATQKSNLTVMYAY